MTLSIEDRVRAHSADRATREALPGPEADAALSRARQVERPNGARPRRGRVGRRLRPGALLVAAVVLVVAGATALVIADDPPSRVDTGPSDGIEPDSTSSPSTRGPTGPPPAPAGPVVSLEGVLGTWSGSEWVRWVDGATPPAGDRYQLVLLDRPVRSAVGAASTVACRVDGSVPGIDVGLEFGGDALAPRPIAVSGVTDPRPRPVEVLDPDAPVYRVPRSRCSPASVSPTHSRSSARSSRATWTATARPRSSSSPTA